MFIVADLVSLNSLLSPIHHTSQYFSTFLNVADLHLSHCKSAYFFALLIGADILLDFSLTVNAAPHECVTRISQP